MQLVTGFIGLMIGLALAVAAWVYGNKKGEATGRASAVDESEVRYAAMRAEIEKTLNEAQVQARVIVTEAKDEAIRLRDNAEKDIKERRNEIQREEDRQGKRRNEVSVERDRLEQLQKKLNQRQVQIERQGNEVEKLLKDRTAALEKAAAMTREEARQELLQAVREESRGDMARVIREAEAEVKEVADQRARKIIIETMQRVATDTVAERTVSTVELPNEEVKGRIIGRNGRNVQSFEQAAGVDVIVDDSPETVTVSCFDPVRREIARRALETLVRDGRIHPQRIEKSLDDARRDVDRIIWEEGERATVEAGVPNLPNEVIKTLGRLRFRTSYGQNQLYHSVETARLAGLLASEFKADIKIAKMGGLLHDIGKALDRENEGTHVQLGVELLKRFNIPGRVVHTVEAHHHDVQQETIEAVIVEIADAVSGSRPGARRETLDAYVKRVRQLEDIARSFQGVQEVYAVQAGREVRIIVKSERIDDLRSIEISREVAKKIEETMQYPGQIKVTVLRETRAVEYAK